MLNLVIFAEIIFCSIIRLVAIVNRLETESVVIFRMDAVEIRSEVQIYMVKI